MWQQEPSSSPFLSNASNEAPRISHFVAWLARSFDFAARLCEMTKTKHPVATSRFSSDSNTWLTWAEATYAGAQTLFRSDNALVWFPAAVLGHHALEMFLKAALIRKGHRVNEKDVWGHDL